MVTVMSGWIQLLLQARLGAEPPVAVTSWVEGCIKGTAPEPAFEYDEWLADPISFVPEYLSPDADYIAFDRGWLTWSDLIANSGSALGAIYGVCFTLAPYCEDGVIAVYWYDFSEYPRTILVQDGRLYECSFGTTPTQLGADDEAMVPWQGETWTVRQKRQHGFPPG